MTWNRLERTMGIGISYTGRNAEDWHECNCADPENCTKPVPGYICRRAVGLPGATAEKVDHPAHYGGAQNPYEAIKVIDAWGLGFCLGNAVKYIARAGRKGDALEDLQKARWYINHEIDRITAQSQKGGPDGRDPG